MISLENTITLADCSPTVQLLIYPEANHGFYFQCPHEFAAEVDIFLGR